MDIQYLTPKEVHERDMRCPRMGGISCMGDKCMLWTWKRLPVLEATSFITFGRGSAVPDFITTHGLTEAFNALRAAYAVGATPGEQTARPEDQDAALAVFEEKCLASPPNRHEFKTPHGEGWVAVGQPVFNHAEYGEDGFPWWTARFIRDFDPRACGCCVDALRAHTGKL